MKKLCLILLTAIPFLASCQNNDVGIQWSKTDQDIMKTHLNNNYLPYIELDELTVSYNRENESVDVTAPNVTEATFSGYKTLLQNDGYTEVVTDCLKEQYTSKGFYTYSKSVSNGVLYVDLYCKDKNSDYTTYGQFNVNAYYYEITAGEVEPVVWTVVEKRIMTTYLDGNILPHCDIANNLVTYDTDGECVRITAPYASATSVQNYLSTLTSNGYTQIATGNEAIGFYQSELPLASSKTLVVQTYTYYNGVNLGTEGEFFVDAFIR